MPMLGHLVHWNVTAFLAVWGALLSTATAGWTLYKDLPDKAKIKLTVSLRCMGRREAMELLTWPIPE
jgi:predicted MFS family arabinose efflux permease